MTLVLPRRVLKRKSASRVYRQNGKKHEATLLKKESGCLYLQVCLMSPLPALQSDFEISPRFHRLIEERIQRLEQNADADEAGLSKLSCPDHLRRHMRLVAAQRAEASRMRRFLERAGTRLPRPLIVL